MTQLVAGVESQNANSGRSCSGFGNKKAPVPGYRRVPSARLEDT